MILDILGERESSSTVIAGKSSTRLFVGGKSQTTKKVNHIPNNLDNDSSPFLV